MTLDFSIRTFSSTIRLAKVCHPSKFNFCNFLNSFTIAGALIFTRVLLTSGKGLLGRESTGTLDSSASSFPTVKSVHSDPEILRGLWQWETHDIAWVPDGL